MLESSIDRQRKEGHRVGVEKLPAGERPGCKDRVSGWWSGADRTEDSTLAMLAPMAPGGGAACVYGSSLSPPNTLSCGAMVSEAPRLWGS